MSQNADENSDDGLVMWHNTKSMRFSLPDSGNESGRDPGITMLRDSDPTIPQQEQVSLLVRSRRDGPYLIVEALLHRGNNEDEPIGNLKLRIAEDDPLATAVLGRQIIPWVLRELGLGEPEA